MPKSKQKKGSLEARFDPNSAPATGAPSPALVATAAPDRRAWGIVLLPALAALIAYAPILRNQFVDSLDDNDNLLQNPAFMGLDWAHVRWAVTTYHVGVYQPLAWVLLEAQYVLWGLAPWGYHLTSLVLYVAEAVALYALAVMLLVRCRAIAAIHGPWPIHLGAGLAVALFVAHPLRDEVVAWVSGQPYLPCALFATLAVLAYLHAHPDGRVSRPGWVIATAGLFVAAMLSKGVAMTLPVVFLILDVYPLRRIGLRREGGLAATLLADPAARAAWAEKLACFVLSGVFAVLNSRARDHAHVLMMGHPLEQGPLLGRVAQASYGVVFYLVKTVWPFGITAAYMMPIPFDWTQPQFVLSIALVAVVTAVLFQLRSDRPAWLAAWLSYLVVLAPNSGLRRIGVQIAADRYSYMAMFGLVVLAAAGLAQLIAARGRAIASACLAIGLTILLALTALSWRQCTYWRDSIALWRHALEFTEIADPNVHADLGMALVKAGDVEAGLDSFKRALHYRPDHFQAHARMGGVLNTRGRFAEAEAHLAEALRLQPTDEVRLALGIALARQGKLAEAETQLATALRDKPDSAEIHDQLGAVLAQQGKLAEAEAHFAAALHGDPASAGVHNNLGAILARQGKLIEAESHFAEAVRLQPDHILARKNLGEALAERGALKQAQSQLAEVLRREPGQSEARLLLGGVLFKQGKLTEAEAQFTEVLRSDSANATAQAALAEIAHRRAHPSEVGP
jgi:Flp pilus assembly protein TadD